MAKKRKSYYQSSKKKRKTTTVKEEAESHDLVLDSEEGEEEYVDLTVTTEEGTKNSSARKAASSSSTKKTKSKENKKENKKENSVDVVDNGVDEEEESGGDSDEKMNSVNDDDGSYVQPRFLGDPMPADEARRLWPQRYEGKKKKVGSKVSKDDDDDDEIIQARCHYRKAEVDGREVYNLYDDAYVKGDAEGEDFIGRIVEMFESDDGTLYFTAQWFYRAKDTVIKDVNYLVDKKRVFFSEIRNVNPLDCLVKKLTIARVSLNMDLDAKKAKIPKCDYYYDMQYLLPYTTFVTLPPECKRAGSETSSTISSDVEQAGLSAEKYEDEEVLQVQHRKSEVTLLDLYSGCGAMSTGLCLGAHMSGVNLVTRWAVDINKYACDSLRLNHPETEVRNEAVEDFLSLLKEWEKLCICFSLVKCTDPEKQYNPFSEEDDECVDEEAEDSEEDGEVFEVDTILGICYGDPNEKRERGLYFKVRWKNYGEEEDTWEPIQGLSNCRERIQKFVTDGCKLGILPLPGDVDVICGGPPCQGISGFNRFRDRENPMNDEKNKQLAVYMEVVEYLKPRFVLMENVVDLVKFSNGFLGRYALGRLIQMNYQARLGLMAAGAYGLPQFRMRCFLWGARPSEKLPQFPLPTHDVVMRGNIPRQFEMNTVAYDEGHNVKLERKLLLEDAISDLPPVENNEHRDELPYDEDPKTDFQRFIRLRKNEMLGLPSESDPSNHVLYDHRPLELNTDDYERSCRIPKKKGANFRDLPGVRVRPDNNRVEWDPDVERVLLKSGKPLVPDYAMTFVDGRSTKPFARLWWDETVPTVVTRAEPHNQAILHPIQDRVLTIRENARLQGFPDYYKLLGPVKERYIQVGNAVAVPVARVLGYALGLAFQGTASDDPLIKLPEGFPNILQRLNSASSEDDAS